MGTEIISDIWVVMNIILIDLALGGDNSIIIGMAAKNLPRDLQKKAIFYGTGGAIILRFLMAAVVVWLLQIPYLKTVGGILLVIIGIKLIGGRSQENVHVTAKDSLLGAIKTIIAADALMSLDNVLGIVAATGGHLGLLLFGMLVSVPIIVYGSTVVIRIMTRFPALIYVGGLILGWAAGGMVATDLSLPFASGNELFIKVGLTVLTVAGGLLWKYLPDYYLT
ncbi:TerC family protein [Megasphaera vaginalis (ex Bordigoni et al. 2020)]|uniref:TerC family protein n=2 Tax=Megasphaera TaxID=906 RepID=UPI001F1A177C|nr:TerC family protein [Megasphaera vaginalis (ex Bordigoni et al. 2020)]